MLEEDYSMSLTKTLFSFNMRKLFCCNICNTSDTQYIQSQHLNLYPSMGDSIQGLIKHSLIGYVTKQCTKCHTDTQHKETSTVIQPPKFMIFVINRYPSLQGGNKNNSSICINKILHLHSSTYHLIGLVNHHGPSTSSGHYTCYISYDNAAFSCNDNLISTVDHQTEKVSKDAYIVIYMHQ